MKNSRQQILLDQVFVISNKIKVLLSVVTLTQPLLLQLSQNRIYYCYSMQLKKITKYRMLCRTQFDRMCWFPKLTLCCWPRRKQIVSTMYKNNIFNCFTWVKIEWWRHECNHVYTYKFYRYIHGYIHDATFTYW